MEDGEEDEEGVDDKRHDVGKRSEGEGHPEPSELSVSETKETVNVKEHASQGRRPRLGLAARWWGKETLGRRPLVTKSGHNLKTTCRDEILRFCK